MTIITAPASRSTKVSIKRPADRRSMSRSATRALEVLECFGKEQRWLRAIEIARMLGLRSSTANQLLKTMLDSAYLVFDVRTKAYFPSPCLTDFSSLMGRAFRGHDRLRLLVADLHVRTGLSVTLSTPNGLFMQILHIEMPSDQHTERGLQVGLFGSAIGSAYISSLSNDTIHDLGIRAGLDPLTLPSFLHAVQGIRHKGYADGIGPDEAVWTIAMPIPSGNSPMPLVLAVAGDRHAIEPAVVTLTTLMKDTLAHWLDGAAEVEASVP